MFWQILITIGIIGLGIFSINNSNNNHQINIGSTQSTQIFVNKKEELQRQIKELKASLEKTRKELTKLQNEASELIKNNKRALANKLRSGVRLKDQEINKIKLKIMSLEKKLKKEEIISLDTIIEDSEEESYNL